MKKLSLLLTVLTALGWAISPVFSPGGEPKGPSGSAIRSQSAYGADYTSGPEGWRYRWHDGRWWYWLPEGRWMYWENDRWADYDANAVQPGLGSGAAGSHTSNYQPYSSNYAPSYGAGYGKSLSPDYYGSGYWSPSWESGWGRGWGYGWNGGGWR